MLFLGISVASVNIAHADLPSCSKFDAKSVSPGNWSTDTKIGDISEISIDFSTIGTTSNGTPIHAWLINNNADQWEITQTTHTFSTDFGTPSSNSSVIFKPYDPQGQLFTAGAHILRLTTGKFPNDGGICEIKYTINQFGQLRCGINDINHDQTKSYGLGDTVFIKGTFYNGFDSSIRYKNQEVDIRIFSKNKINTSGQDDQKTNDLGDFTATRTIPIFLKPEDMGLWYITASPNGLNDYGQQTCTRQIYVSEKSGEPIPEGITTSGSQTGLISAPVDTPMPSAPPAPCAEFSPDKKQCIKVSTALGDIGTKPEDFITSIFGYLLGISGGIALLLIIIAGYKLMASQGDAEKVKEARESLTSAIVGLLFIIFSLVILQIIGVDILKIPGFGA